MKKFNNYKNIEIFSTLTVKDAERLKIPQWQVNKRKFHQQTPVPGEKRYHCGTCNKDYKNIAQHNSKKHKTSQHQKNTLLASFFCRLHARSCKKIHLRHRSCHTARPQLSTLVGTMQINVSGGPVGAWDFIFAV